MKNKKIFSFLLILFGLFTLAFSIKGNIMKGETNNSHLNSMSNDSIPGDTTNTDNPNEGPEISSPKDLSSSFNERGFYKSNSFNANGNEIINDFNGNLCYSIPIASKKDRGDLAFDLSLNYNGNVNYQIICGDSSITKNTSGHLDIYNFSAPGWIFSLNGLAVQMINFETDYFTNITPEVNGNNIRLLASGYQITDVFTNPTSDNKDKITIMLGDGSTETLENTQPSLYTGEYRSTTINSPMKAFVYYNTNEIPEYYQRAGTCRIMYLMKGDGLTYIYEESVMEYNDHHSLSVAAWFKPTTFLLTKIKDRFGNTGGLIYRNDMYPNAYFIGRKLLQFTPIGSFNYPMLGENYRGIQFESIENGNYLFSTEEYRINANGNHRPRLTEIRNPFGETMSFLYESYTRTGTNLTSRGNNMTIKFDNTWPLYRLSQFQNYDGGKRAYLYTSNTFPQISYSDNRPYEAGAHSNDDNYKGQGRDLFFSNMISRVTETENNVDIKKVDYDYPYEHLGRTIEDVWQYPVNPNDKYKTSKTITSLNGDNLNGTPNSYKSEKLYRNYIVKAIPTGEYSDYSGTTKLVEEKFFANGESPEYRKMNYFYYRGTFLDSAKIENISGAERKWHYAYTGGGYYPITRKQETDPLGLVTSTYLQSFQDTSLRVYKDGYFRLPGAEYDTVKFYLINQPTSITVSKGSDTLQKKEILYYSSNNVTGTEVLFGYPGQVRQEKDINPQNSNDVLRSTSYKYSNKDTTGRYLHPNYVNGREGNLMETEDAKGNKTKYYYDIISGNEGSLLNKLSYHKLKDDGSDVILTEDWSGNRFPSRIDNYVDGDRYLSHYQLYNDIGNPTKVVNENKYLSEAEYDYYNRLTRLTLPYDFNDLSDTIITKIDSMELPLSICSRSLHWGSVDEFNDTNSFLGGEDQAPGFGIEYIHAIGDPDNIREYNFTGLVEYNQENFSKIGIIDSAYLVFSSYYMTTKLDNVNTNDYSFRITPLSAIGRFGNYKDILKTFNGIGHRDVGNFIVKDSSNCSSEEINKYRYDCNYKKIDVKDLLQSNVTNGGLNLQGMKFSINYTSQEAPLNGILNFHMAFFPCTNPNYNYWWTYYSPRIYIYFKQIVHNTIRNVKHRSGSLIYTYDDAGNKVTIESKIDKQNGFNRNKKVENYFDGFGYLKQSKIYTSADSSNVFTTNYNYLYQKAKTTDAAGNSTKFSYDKYGSLAKTKNADTSKNYVSNTFQNSFNTTFYNISNGFVNKQVYTDETNRKFEKYYDAVGNLLREVKYVVDESMPDNPFDPDTTIENYPDQTEIALTTDYRYDDLYRVVEVKTPENKRINYSYDLLGRQTQRTTPDAGLTKYSYDANNNLVYSQDANQRARGSNIFTFRNYDGLNRLLSIGEMPVGNLYPPFENMNPDSPSDLVGNPNQMLTVNVYDSLIYSSVNVFTNVPSDYYVTGQKNNTKGALVATAYRTRVSDSWGFKFYRYDARGRVIKMWHYITGLGWKTQLYSYNSQNQVTSLNYDPSNSSDGKLFCYSYDNTDRLKDVKLLNGIPSEEMNEDYPGEYFTFASYTYNKNSQISHYMFNNNTEDYHYSYNSRNWVTNFGKTVEGSMFKYGLGYNTNGNIRISATGGVYRSLLDPSGNPLNIEYIYDKSNRLLKADKLNESNNSFDVYMSYDNDGNFLTLNRYGSNSNVIDNYSYSYYIGTNKLSKVSGQDAQYIYDANGNMTRDGRDASSIRDGMVYDNRNLLIEMILHNTSTGMGAPVTEMRKLVFDYDEAGNRVRKREYLHGATESTPGTGDGGVPTAPDGGIESGTWNLVGDEYYSRDISGKEIGIYHSNDLYQWNVWGTDNVGKITANGAKFFYLKDHLGTIRVVLDASNNIVSANDYDCWGYPLENRSYQGNNTDYKFTGKQRDKESGYDYFGARYYDARIANWGSIDPLFEKHIQWTPYNYVLRNPMALIDPDGKQIKITGNVGFKYILDNFGVSGVTYDKNDMSKLIYTGDAKNRSKLEYDQKFIVNLIEGKVEDKNGYRVILNMVLSESTFSIEGKNIGIPGESFMGYDIDESTKTITCNQYFSADVIDDMRKAGIYEPENVIQHGVIEGAIGGRDKLSYKEAHSKAPVLSYGMKVLSFFKDYKYDDKGNLTSIDLTVMYRPEYKREGLTDRVILSIK